MGGDNWVQRLENLAYQSGYGDGQRDLHKKINEYLEVIKKDNSRPTYRWNKESHGVLGLIDWLENLSSREEGNE